MRSALLLALAATLAVAADGPKEDKVKEALKKLEGTWVVESSVAEGENESRDLGLEYIFDGEKLTVQHPQDGNTKKYTCKVDPSASPQAIDLTRAEDKYVFKYIYEIKEATLRLCIKKDEPEQRAAEFKEGQGYTLMVLKRPKH